MSREVHVIRPRFIVGVLLIAIIAGAIATIFIPKQTESPLSELERISLEERSAKVVNYLEEIDKLDEFDKDNEQNPLVGEYPLDRYITYALEYSYNENDKSELSVKEIKKILSNTFDFEFNEEAINNVGVTPLLLDKNVNHDPSTKTYSIKKDFDKRQIAAIPVSKYIVKDSYANKDKSVYTIIYDKYAVKSPYDILPHIDGSDTKDYLEGKGKIAAFKDAITAENAKEITNPEKETTVEYVLKEGKLLIKAIR